VSEGTIRQEVAPSGAPRAGRRLPDRILSAFHHACDLGEFEVAAQLLRTLELLVTRRTPEPDADRRRSLENLVAAHERLWQLRHTDTGRQG
jgi:hypothetical protein